MKKLYYNIIIAFKVWLASMDYEVNLYAFNYSHLYFILEDYKQRLQWHYFGMPQYVKDAFYYKAIWHKKKDEYLEKILNRKIFMIW